MLIEFLFSGLYLGIKGSLSPAILALYINITLPTLLIVLKVVGLSNPPRILKPDTESPLFCGLKALFLRKSGLRAVFRFKIFAEWLILLYYKGVQMNNLNH